MSPGRVWLVGAGPGDPDLITVRGRRLLERADAVVHDRLVSRGLLDLIPSGVLRVDVGKTGYGPAASQDGIHASLIRLARAGLGVVRLKGGDPFVFGRGGEEAEALREAGIPFSIVPGVTSGTAGPALAGIPLTYRGMARSVAFVTATVGHHGVEAPTTAGITEHDRSGGRASDQPEAASARAAPATPRYDWDALACLDTLVVFMAGRAAASVAERLLGAGRHPLTPAALIIDASLPSREVRITDLASLAASGAGPTEGRAALLVVGDVVALHERIRPRASEALAAGLLDGGAV